MCDLVPFKRVFERAPLWCLPSGEFEAMTREEQVNHFVAMISEYACTNLLAPDPEAISVAFVIRADDWKSFAIRIDEHNNVFKRGFLEGDLELQVAYEELYENYLLLCIPIDHNSWLGEEFDENNLPPHPLGLELQS